MIQLIRDQWATVASVLASLASVWYVAKYMAKTGLRPWTRNFFRQLSLILIGPLLSLLIMILIAISSDDPVTEKVFVVVLFSLVPVACSILFVVAVRNSAIVVPDTVHNERIKLTAGALDRGATIFFTVGVATPLAATLLGESPGLPESAVIGVPSCFVAGLVLHLIARRVLGGLRDKS